MLQAGKVPTNVAKEDSDFENPGTKSASSSITKKNQKKGKRMPNKNASESEESDFSDDSKKSSSQKKSRVKTPVPTSIKKQRRSKQRGAGNEEPLNDVDGTITKTPTRYFMSCSVLSCDIL
jgi:hypothetical protein